MIFFCSSSSRLCGQQLFIPTGKITFEKKVNLQRNLAGWNLSDETREKIKKYQISSWELSFNESSAIYFSESSANQLYSDYSSRTRVLKKTIIGEDYLLNDTIPHIDWKIMDEIRTISGYECRKAIGRIQDTIYVVAFYTDEILLKGGPEGFSGLPGMILGLAIPRYSTTWFATKVDALSNNAAQIVSPQKGKKIESEKDLSKLIELYSRYEGIKNEAVKKRIYGFTL
ncbi:GLPGLI family protein [Pedobacter metabolipauper]|uniref:GLPGLI family protein n=2 Tax=Pedobacter metabolipauper TaxID=425513 RepID=A0A4R6SYJ7_9SPHI|nr:GLPGLI family protein [Pedobacter metabolipauper]